MKNLLQRFLLQFARNLPVDIDKDGKLVMPSFDSHQVEDAFKARLKPTVAEREMRRQSTFYDLLRRMHRELNLSTSMHYGQRKNIEFRIRAGSAFRFRAFKGLDLTGLRRPIVCPFCIFMDCDFSGSILEDSNLDGSIFVQCAGSNIVARRSRLRNMDGLATSRSDGCLEDVKEELLDDLAAQEMVS